MSQRLSLFIFLGILALAGCAIVPNHGAPNDAPSWSTLAQKNVLAWTPEEQRLGYPNVRKIRDTRELMRSSDPYPLPVALWSDVDQLHQAMSDLALAGLIVVQDDVIRFEAYREGHNEQARWMSFSIAKSVVSMLYGLAIEDGYIGSLNETVADHLPEFRDTGYGEVELGHLLQMASGVAWNEDYQDPNSDVAKLNNANEQQVLQHLASLPRRHEPGTVFNYNTGETTLAGAILRRALGMTLSDYLNAKIWSAPMGMADEADWALMSPNGAEMGGCCISATLRDYARIGLWAMAGSHGHGGLPADWMYQSTQASAGADYYGFFWWLEENGDYRASGIFGQSIYISPSQNLVIATHGLWPVATDETFSQKREELIDLIKRVAVQSASD